MLPRAHRLTATSEIEQIYKHGRRVFHPLIRLVYCPGAQVVSRATVVVSKRVDKRAVERNRLKRIIRALLPELLASLTRLPRDLVIIVQPSARGATQLQLATALHELIKKVA